MAITAGEILAELEGLGSVSYKKTLMTNHGVREPFFGVKVGDLKKIQKRVKTDYRLALDLWESGNYDAMYLAGLIADDARMTKKDLARWVAKAERGALASATVAWVAAGSPHGPELAREWIDSSKSHVAVAGWSTWSSLVATRADSELDIAELKKLLARVAKTIHAAPDHVRAAMNGFVIALGSCVTPLHELAIATGKKIGAVTADLGHNACRIPYAPDYIAKVAARGSIGAKRRTAKC